MVSSHPFIGNSFIIGIQTPTELGWKPPPEQKSPNFYSNDPKHQIHLWTKGMDTIHQMCEEQGRAASKIYFGRGVFG